MKRFLRELEAALAKMSPADRDRVGKAYVALVRTVRESSAVFSGLFRPSAVAVLMMLNDLTKAMRPGGGDRMIAELKKVAPTIGPNVTPLVQAL